MPQPRFQERHFDYVFSLGNVSAGALLQGVPLVLDPDAPFVLRSRAIRVTTLSAESPVQNGLSGLKMRFAGPNKNYFSEGLIRQSLLAPYYGQFGSPIPQWPPVQYPASGTIYADVQNTSLVTLTNLTLYFRGVKLFPYGQVPAYAYPPRMAGLPFIYPQTMLQLPVTTPTNGVRGVFQVQGDADFVFRSGQAGRSFTPLAYEVSITLRDFNLNPYSNAPVNIDVLFGKGAPPAAFPIGQSAFIAPIGTGPSQPGILYPEIYLPRNHVLFYDVVRSDAAYTGAAACDYPIAFTGMKVFQK